ncbi:MAG TPA: hypothetical protein VFT64_10390 [Rickettsiales bacterium]|nr:hypothetical protein [Rickettsiales bacterium]
MKHSKIVMAAIGLCACCVTPAMAGEKAASAQNMPQLTTAADAGQSETPKAIQALLGNISAALVSSDYGMNDDAIHYLGKARQNLSDLEKNHPDLKTLDHLHLGRIEYTVRPPAGTKYKQWHFALFPFEERVFAVSVPAIDTKREKQLGIIPKGAGTTSLHMEWDNARIKVDLEKAIKELSDRNTAEAIKVLQTILSTDMVTTEIEQKSNDMLQGVYDNIVLADDLLQQGDYGFTRLALEHARSQLSHNAATVMLKYNGQEHSLSTEIQAAEAELKTESPGIAEKIREKMRQWIDTLKSSMTAK